MSIRGARRLCVCSARAHGIEEPRRRRSSRMSDRSVLSAEAAPDALLEVPPSAKLVVKVLENEGELTQEQLAAETLLPARTARYAVGKLEDHDLITSRVSLMDARKRRYSLNADRFPELTIE